MHRPSPFMLHAWLRAWWEHHASEREMRVEAAFAGDRLIAGVPLEIERRIGGARVAHCMGRHHAALADVLIARGAPRETADEIFRALRNCGAHWVDFFGPARGGTLVGSRSAPDVTAIERVEAPVLEMTNGWDEAYRRNVDGKKRSLHRRRRRQLEGLGRVDLAVATTPSELEPALDAAFDLHDLRWFDRADTSEFTTATGRRFYRDVTASLGQTGAVRITLLRVDGRPVAFHYGFLFEQVFFNHRLAFDPAFARASPGLITTLAAIEAAAVAGAKRVEFLGGGERYKLELADRIDPLYQCVGFAAGRLGTIGASAAVAATRTRLRLKRSERLHRWYIEGLSPARRAFASKTRRGGG